jgi:tetratricopeptide (TPR) repeat protein
MRWVTTVPRKPFPFLLILLVGMAYLSFPSATIPVYGQTKVDWSDRASELEEARDWPGLLAHCEKWSKAQPDNYIAWFVLGIASKNLGRHREAIKAYRESLRLKPDYANAWLNLGALYSDLKIYPDAIKACQEALRINPDLFEPWFNLGLTYIRMNRYQAAIKPYREGLRIKPDYVQAWFNLGLIYSSLKRYPEAIQAYRQGLDLKPDNADAWYNLAACYAKSGNRSAAMEAVKELRRYDPKEADKLSRLIPEEPGASKNAGNILNQSQAVALLKKYFGKDLQKGSRLQHYQEGRMAVLTAQVSHSPTGHKKYQVAFVREDDGTWQLKWVRPEQTPGDYRGLWPELKPWPSK